MFLFFTIKELLNFATTFTPADSKEPAKLRTFAPTRLIHLDMCLACLHALPMIILYSCNSD